MNLKKPIFKFSIWGMYIIFVAALFFGSAFLLYQIHNVVIEYDATLPELVVEKALDDLKSDMNEGYSPNFVIYPTIGSEKYDDPSLRNPEPAFISSVTAAKEITYQPLNSSSSDDGTLKRTFTIYFDGKASAVLSLIGRNSRNKLFFFSMADWEIDSLTPSLSAVYYHLKIYLPDNLSCYLDGIEVGEEDFLTYDNGVRVFEVNQLLHAPAVEVKDQNGEDVTYKIENEVVYPLQYHFSLSLPETVSVFVNDVKIEGSRSENTITYTIAEMLEPTVILKDLSGFEKQYHMGDTIQIYQYQVTLPQSFTLTVGDYAPQAIEGSEKEHKDAQLMLEHVGENLLPSTVDYSFGLLDDRATLKVINNLGKIKYYSPETRTLTISDWTSYSIVPTMVSNLDPLYIAHRWSWFMTDDLGGEKHGFYTIAEYLIKDSYYYNYALKWATGIDISFIYSHTLNGFTDESVTDIIKYSDTCLSCIVKFTKNMTIYAGGKPIYDRADTFCCRMYFVYIDDTPDNGVDDPHWAIAFMYDVV